MGLTKTITKHIDVRLFQSLKEFEFFPPKSLEKCIFQVESAVESIIEESLGVQRFVRDFSY